MVKKTGTGKNIASGISSVLTESEKATKAALERGLPEESPLTKQYYSGVRNLGQYGDAAAAEALARTGNLYERYGQAAGYNKTPFEDIAAAYREAGTYDPSKFTMADYTTRNIAERMSPYEKLVSEQATARLKKAYDEARGEREAQAVRAGAFGGSGAAVQEEAARRNYLEQMAQQNAQNLQSAYESAVNLYGKEVADRLNSEQLAEASRQFSKQTELSGIEGIMAARQQEAAQTAAAKEAEFAGLSGMGSSAAQQGSLAADRKRMEASNLAALQEAGAQQQGYQLAKIDRPMDVVQEQANVLAAAQGGATPIQSYKAEKPSTLQQIAAGGAALAGAATGLFGRDGGLVPYLRHYSQGGYVYRGGGLADLEPQYYDTYER